VAVGAAPDDEHLSFGGDRESRGRLSRVREPPPDGARDGGGRPAVPRQIGDEGVEAIDVLSGEGGVQAQAEGVDAQEAFTRRAASAAVVRCRLRSDARMS
jgi:hypothetical protein